MKKVVIIIILVSSFLYSNKQIDIDLSEQIAYAIEDGEIVFYGRISSGKRGHRTPTGTFKILEKDRYHRSNKYPKPNGGARMYYMLRLTNYGIAMHQGRVPRYAASHGCIRMRKHFAKKMYKWARHNIEVNVYGDAEEYVYYHGSE